jgi:PRTRC genetic system protein B
LIWYRPPAPATLLLPGGALTARQPGLVFVAQAAPRQLTVFVVDGDAWPGEDTPLRGGLYPNVYPDGRMCQGSVQLPDTLTPGRQSDWEACFFGSRFTAEVTANNTGVPLAYDAPRNQIVTWGGTGVFAYTPLR